jgi:RNA polymerase sigma-70 factor (ECF subfamily)
MEQGLPTEPAPNVPRLPNGEASDGSLVRRFRSGSQDAATDLYLRYAERLRALARGKVNPTLATRVDPDDIVQSVFRSFFQAALQGLYDVPAGEELWKILMVIALNKIRNQREFHLAAKRDARLTLTGEVFEEALEDKEPEKESDAFLRLVIAEALESLPPAHRHMVELRIHGFDVAQIAEKTGRSKRTTERILQEARTKLYAIFHEAE